MTKDLRAMSYVTYFAHTPRLRLSEKLHIITKPVP